MPLNLFLNVDAAILRIEDLAQSIGECRHMELSKDMQVQWTGELCFEFSQLMNRRKREI